MYRPSRLAAMSSLVCIMLSSAVRADVPVTVETFVRAETDGYFVDNAKGGVGVWEHTRTPVMIEDQRVIRLNRDTLCSFVVLDLTSPATVTLPDAGDRFRSILVINEDHYDKLVAYDAGDYTLTQDEVGTRYAMVAMRIFVDPNNPDDIAAANALQDATTVTQDDRGALEVPDWNQEHRSAIRELLNQLAAYSDGSGVHFGDTGEVDPVNHLIYTAAGWGGKPPAAAVYQFSKIPNNDGKVPYSLTVGDVPVDGFWSITVDNQEGYMEGKAEEASLNNVTATPNDDGTVTVHFGGDPAQPNYLHIMPGWNYTARLYRPGAEILDGSWTFPAPTE